MTRVPRRTLAALVAAAALAAGALGTATVAQAEGYEDPTMDLPRNTGKIPGVGPYWPYVQEIQINTVVPMKNQAAINPTEHGLLFRAGQQHTRLTVTLVDGRLRFHDTGTLSWKYLPDVCAPLRVETGVAASCEIPAEATTAQPMLLEVWPRIGNDTVDTTALPSLVDVSFLGDRGIDVAKFGAGNDFFNGAQDVDRGYGGEGRDWIRTGLANDYINGGAGGDHLVGVAEDDVIYGGDGDDRLGGDDGNDKIYAGTGADFAVCGNGTDNATIDGSDRASKCERLYRY